MSPYRNFLEEARQRLGQARSLSSARAKRLAALRPLLPRGLRRDLDRLERSIEQPLKTQRDVEVAERVLAEYEERLELAIAFSDHVVRDLHARRRIQLAWLRWVMAGASVFAFLTVFVIVDEFRATRAYSHASASECMAGTVCALPAPELPSTNEPPPTSDADCARARDWKAHGACALVGGPGGECGPTTQDHCALSAVCAERGLCSLVDGVCVNPTGTNPCGLSVECAHHGLCATRAEGCFANSNDDCRASWACQIDGRCQAAAGRCSAETDQDCAMSRRCQLEGRCTACGGRCLSVDDFAASAATPPKLL